MHKNNHCWVVGNLGSDPHERASKNGSVVSFAIAENVQTYDSESKTYKTVHTNWFQVAAFGNLAERTKSSLKKGDRVVVQGKMKVSKFKDKAGEERTGFEIIADEVALWKSLGASSGTRSGGREATSDFDDDLPF